jgi:RpiB/LacA/LacB family sugar-phosphate isomerase
VKRLVIETLRDLGVQVEDAGPSGDESVDYPDYAATVARAVGSGRADCGVLVCGTGIGMSIAANKIPGVRAALVRDVHDAEMSRLHNDSNVLVLGADSAEPEQVRQIVRAWCLTEFEGGRHARRVEKISDLERRGKTRNEAE